jgi:hypothetical protein
MGLFSNWGNRSSGSTIHTDELELDRVPKTARTASDDLPSLAEFLGERDLISTDDASAVEEGRARVETSGLVTTMLETCASINSIAGKTIIEAQCFLPPEPILCCFIFVDGGTEYLIRLELQGAIPTLVFSERRWRDKVTNDFVRWLHRLADIEPVVINVRLVHEFQDPSVPVEQVRKWFMYLVSGMERSYMPSF